MRSITSRDGSLTRPFKAVEQVTFGGGDSNMTNDIFVLDRLASSETNDCGQRRRAYFVPQRIVLRSLI